MRLGISVDFTVKSLLHLFSLKILDQKVQLVLRCLRVIALAVQRVKLAIGVSKLLHVVVGHAKALNFDLRDVHKLVFLDYRLDPFPIVRHCGRHVELLSHLNGRIRIERILVIDARVFEIVSPNRSWPTLLNRWQPNIF
jgi:hypothetical protein